MQHAWKKRDTFTIFCKQTSVRYYWNVPERRRLRKYGLNSIDKESWGFVNTWAPKKNEFLDNRVEYQQNPHDNTMELLIDSKENYN